MDAILLVRKAVLSPTVQMAHIKALERERPSIRYDPWTARSTPYRKVPYRTRTRTSSSGRYRNDSSCGVSTTMPTTAITLKKTFHAKNNGIYSWPSMWTVVKSRPNRSSQISRPVRSFVNLFSATGNQAQEEGNEMTSPVA